MTLLGDADDVRTEDNDVGDVFTGDGVIEVGVGMRCLLTILSCSSRSCLDALDATGEST